MMSQDLVTNLLTLNEAARRAGRSAGWVQQQHRTGRLPAVRTGGTSRMRLFHADDVDRVRAEGTGRQQDIEATRG